jgi:hypothetical protein
MFRSLQGHRVNFITLAIIGGLGWGGYLMYLRSQPQAWDVLLFISIGLGFFATLFNYWRLLMISEAPISTIAAAAQGYIELHGTGSTTKPLLTPFQSIPCVWYRAWVYANRYDEESGKRDTHLLEYVESDQLFQLSDHTGMCTINPKGAEIIYAEQRTQLKNDHRYVEEYLPAAKPLYLLGYLDTRHNLDMEEHIKQHMGKLLATWKTNPVKMLLRFDRDRNGKIDMLEWELARTEARREAEIHYQMRVSPQETFTLSKPQGGKLFLISALSPQSLRNRYQCWSLIHLGLLILLLTAYVKVT